MTDGPVTDDPVTVGSYTWEEFKAEYYYDENGERPREKDGTVVPFDPSEYLDVPPARMEEALAGAAEAASVVEALVDRRTVNTNPDVDEDLFFSTVEGHPTLVTRYDLERAVPMEKKPYFREVERYWVNKPYAFVVVFHSSRENEKKYYVVEPYLTDIEERLRTYLTQKLRTAVKYADDDTLVTGDDRDREAVIDRETRRLLDRYQLYTPPSDSEGVIDRLRAMFDREERDDEGAGPRPVSGVSARPEAAILAENAETLTEYQVEKLMYFLKRNFLGYERIDPVKHDINVEDISCDGYDSPVFVYHMEYEQLITNISHGRSDLDSFVIKMAQRSGKGISKRRPQVDATLPDGSRAQLTLGKEVSDHGTNYTIRQFKDVPFTPIDLINWHTFSFEEMVFLWLAIENNRSLIFAGGTASGKTTSLNAVSLFIPCTAKIVSIENTREVELPQRNWIASVTRPSFNDERSDIDEFDLLEAALRQRPEYIIMGEVRGEEGRTLFQTMSTGHTTLTTFHADSVGEVIKRFTTEPINVSKTMFTALDLVSVQTQSRVRGQKVRRSKAITEINHYDGENDEINVRDVYQWQPLEDEFLRVGSSKTLKEITFDNGWDEQRLEEELFKRRVVLAYLIVRGLKEYSQVAATLQAFINDQDTILALIAQDSLEASLEDLRKMESVLIDVAPEKEAIVPRPDPDPETLEYARSILAEAEDRLFEEYRDTRPATLASALAGIEPAADVAVETRFDGGFEDPDAPDAESTDGTAPETDRQNDDGE